MKKNQPKINHVVMGCVLALAMALPAAAQAQDAKQILEKAFQARILDGSEAVMSLTIVNKKGQKRVREIAAITKTFDGGKTEKKLFRFLAPADVKGTGILAFDYDKKADDMWIFLPALRKTRRIVSSEKGKAFMGSEFSYADMSSPVLSDYKLKVVKSEKAGGTDCWVIEALPKNDKVAEGEGYSKKMIWIAKSDNMVRKSVYYDLDGELLKELTAKSIVMVDKKKKRYRAKHMEMINKQNGRKSIFQTKKIENSPNAKDSYFTTSYLERP